MKCPHCETEINDKILSRHLASEYGKRSKRTLTTQQAKEMSMKRWASRKIRRSL